MTGLPLLAADTSEHVLVAPSLEIVPARVSPDPSGQWNAFSKSFETYSLSKPAELESSWFHLLPLREENLEKEGARPESELVIKPRLEHLGELPTPSTCMPPSPPSHTHKPYSPRIHTKLQPEGAHCSDLRALRPEGRVSADRLSHLSCADGDCTDIPGRTPGPYWVSDYVGSPGGPLHASRHLHPHRRALGSLWQSVASAPSSRQDGEGSGALRWGEQRPSLVGSRCDVQLSEGPGLMRRGFLRGQRPLLCRLSSRERGCKSAGCSLLCV